VSDYTPTTEEIRLRYSDSRYWGEELDTAFYRWLAEVKAEAWEEGAVWQRENAVPDDRRMKVRFVSELQAVNPYREGEK
jgi:hypothetical protein